MEPKHKEHTNIGATGALASPPPTLDKGSGTEASRKPTIIDDDDIRAMVKPLRDRPRLVRSLMRLMGLDPVNALHARHCHEPGAPFARATLDDLDITLEVDNGKALDDLPPGAFVTVSNHHFGALDGVMLIDLIGSRRPGFKVMVNMFLNYIWALSPSFIAVDANATSDPKKRAVSVAGIKEAISRVRSGEPVGFFPAGAVAKINWRGRLRDRAWQPNIVQLIQKLRVPVVPVFFHGSQSWLFNLLGVVWWQGRTFLHPREVFRKKHATMRVTVGDAITVEEQQAHQGSVEEFAEFLRSRTYALRDAPRTADARVTILPTPRRPKEC